MRRAVIVMAKRPWPGAVKTRLIPALGPAGAASLYQAMLLDVLDEVATVADATHYLLVHPPEALAWFEHAATQRFVVAAQRGATLAERMAAAFDDRFAEGFDAVVLRNSDSPTLPAARIGDALDALARGVDVVLGPDLGGGYYLVALKATRAQLFRPGANGPMLRFDEALGRARAARLAVSVLPRWLDVDTPADLVRLRKELAAEGDSERPPCTRTAAFLAAWVAKGNPPPAP